MKKSAGNQVEIRVEGMDCAGCVRTVKNAIGRVEGVNSVEVLLSSEKAIIESAGGSPDLGRVKRAVEEAGYRVPDGTGEREEGENREGEELAARVLRLFGIVFGAVLLVVVAGEWMGLFDALTGNVPVWLGTVLVLIAGYPVFRKVIRSALKGNVIAHSLMAMGAVAALVVGEWVTAAIVVFFMRTGDYIEAYTADRARDSLRSLSEFAPETATVIREGEEREIPAGEVRVGETVIVRPGGQVPVDGEVIGGKASVDQSAVTGESMPVEVVPGSGVFSASIVHGGSLRIRTTGAGEQSTFGKIVRMVEQAEARKGEVQRFADRFSAYYLPVVAAVALGTWLISGDTMATVAVMVVACSCAFALATPVALLASIGSSAHLGILIKGGKYLENLGRADVLLVDKTGTLTLGKPEITDVITLNGMSETDLIRLAASAERYSEHPLGKAIVEEAHRRRISLEQPERFESISGTGIRAAVGSHAVAVGNRRDLAGDLSWEGAGELEKEGKTVMVVTLNGSPAGLLAARDAERGEVREALDRLRDLGLTRIELLTGDNENAARQLAGNLGLDYRAELLPEEKIAIVRRYQSEGRTVIMVGDGINDAPALAQADVGIAMRAAGTDVAVETADITLMRDDWLLVPELMKTAYRTMNIIKGNFAFTVVYSLAGLSLAATGILPPILAAAAQSLPDVGIMLNSSRLLRSAKNGEGGRETGDRLRAGGNAETGRP